MNNNPIVTFRMKDGKTFYVHGNNLYQDYDFLETERGADGLIGAPKRNVVSSMVRFGKK